MSQVIAAMLVGPDEGHRHLDRVLRCAEVWADEIVVRTDGADGDTLDAVAAQAGWMAHNDLPLFPIDESAARNSLLELVDRAAAPGDLVVVLDADEELVDLGGGNLTRTLADAGESIYATWPCLFAHLWTPDGTLMRTDRGWAPGYAVRIYRHVPGLRIPDREFACQPVPHLSGCCPLEESPFGIRHWGYAYPHDRPRKAAWYASRDGGRFHNPDHLRSITEEPTLEPTCL